ncbi:MAG: hydroxymethylbilane synthase [Planctomycetes bacterium]|nr:hydroxymethylbilane synthase [Planctomycetota bacterium]
MKGTIRVGSRASALAVAQAKLILRLIEKHSGLRTELVTMPTTGDRILDRPLAAVGGKGLFTRELDQALRDGRVDICVHSLKDLPTPDNPDLPVVAVRRRDDPRDVLVLPAGRRQPVPVGPVGTSSLRRRLLLQRLQPGWTCRPVRGNILTRLEKLDAGEYGGLILAAAGMHRLGLGHRCDRYFSVAEMLPAAGQGIVAVQGRAGDDHRYLAGFDDADARDAARAERAFVETLGAGCSAPVAAYAAIQASSLTLDGWYVAATGEVRRGSLTVRREEAAAAGRELACRLQEKGRFGV